jgi:hydrogenase maturation protein HypF
MKAKVDLDRKERLRITVRGAVQGVGFRPFVYRLAVEMGICGWVYNSPQGVFIEAEGERSRLQLFLARLKAENPPRSSIQSLETVHLDPVGYESFEIQVSRHSVGMTAVVMPDIATCPDCLAEIFDPANARFRYPFTNCTNCGPRFSIIESLPYDRARTTMKKFSMCDHCRREYEDPLDRRFHAQPDACPKCGPALSLWNESGRIIGERDEALLAACNAISAGKIVAVKGLGGFHLIVDARNNEAVERLRHLKVREEKPLAMMFPSLEAVEDCCLVDNIESALLVSPESPIVLLRRKADCKEIISDKVAPGNPYLGVMLPYTPLHHLMMKELRFPIVATSGNLSDEPICIDEHEAAQRLKGIADLFLVHDRPIARHVDDSVVRQMAGRGLVMRRARGYAPLPIHVKNELPPILAVGAHLKNTVAIAIGNQVVVSQHIGDLETAQAYEAFIDAQENLAGIYEFKPGRVACDLHPDYLSTNYARRLELPLTQVQHHHAHVLSCMAENEISPPALGISWDGAGYGLDGTIWGGEFLEIDDESFERFGHLRTFKLPGGDRAIVEPRRAAIGLLYEIFGDDLFDMTALACVKSFSKSELNGLRKMLQAGLNSPVTSSVGRLFDAISSIIGVRQVSHFEGQAAMELEHALDGHHTGEYYSIKIAVKENCRIVDWEPMVRQIIEDLQSLPSGRISAKFHNTLAGIIVEIAKLSERQRVVLSGGCFQNRYLTETAIERLRGDGLLPYWHQRIPPNDGGIALGQIMASSNFDGKERH